MSPPVPLRDNDRLAACLQTLSQSLGGSPPQWAESGVGGRHHLCPAPHRLRLPGGTARQLVALLCRLAALDQAIAIRQPIAGLIHHSDQGVQYASDAYIDWLDTIGARISMAAVGNPYENAKAERFFRALKHEEVYLNQYDSFADADANIGHFIDDVYNIKRLHSSLGYQPPAEVEAAWHAACREGDLTRCPV